MNSIEHAQCIVQHAIGGLEATEGCLSTTVELTKQVKPIALLPPSPPPPHTHTLGESLGIKWQQNSKMKEGVCVCGVCLCTDKYKWSVGHPTFGWKGEGVTLMPVVYILTP